MILHCKRFFTITLYQITLFTNIIKKIKLININKIFCNFLNKKCNGKKSDKQVGSFTHHIKKLTEYNNKILIINFTIFVTFLNLLRISI
jgi:hypothetical protein